MNITLENYLKLFPQIRQLMVFPPEITKIADEGNAFFHLWCDDEDIKAYCDELLNKINEVLNRYSEETGIVFRTMGNGQVYEITNRAFLPGVDNVVYWDQKEKEWNDRYGGRQESTMVKTEKKVVSSKKVRSKTKNGVKQQKTTTTEAIYSVEKIPLSVAYIKRYVSLHKKTKTREQILSMIKSMQKAIAEKQLRKADAHAKEITLVQNELIQCHTDMIKAKALEVEIELSNTELHKFKDIINMYGVDSITSIATAYLRWLTNKDVIQAKTLLTRIDKLNNSENGLLKEIKTALSYETNSLFEFELSGVSEEIQRENSLFNVQLLKYLDKKNGRRDIIIFKVFGELYPSLSKMRITQSVLKKAIKKHDIDLVSLLNLPEKISAPEFIFKSKSKANAKVVVIATFDKQGNRIVLPFDFDINQYTGTIHNITSIYGKEQKLLDNWLALNLAEYKKSDRTNKARSNCERVNSATLSGVETSGKNLAPNALQGAKVEKISETTKKIATAAELTKMDFETRQLDPEFANIIGRPSQNFSIMIFGKPGSGKTTFSLLLAKSLSQREKVLFATIEEGLNHTLQEKLRRLNACSENLVIADHLPSNLEIFDVIFIDSVNTMGLSPIELRKLKEKYPKKSFAYILQATKSGNFKGAQEYEHDTDVVVEVKSGVASTIGRKNRFGVGGEYQVF